MEGVTAGETGGQKTETETKGRERQRQTEGPSKSDHTTNPALVVTHKKSAVKTRVHPSRPERRVRTFCQEPPTGVATGTERSAEPGRGGERRPAAAAAAGSREVHYTVQRRESAEYSSAPPCVLFPAILLYLLQLLPFDTEHPHPAHILALTIAPSSSSLSLQPLLPYAQPPSLSHFLSLSLSPSSPPLPLQRTWP
ncbi:unnamed protein product [Pleuronectes platessa]|uniref:Uncharacterized protein n=1 Tax=Pleuronectes platessa TaxID=8262 RepID=A0A9N7VEI6_PLEPL|nr:unnamed protein product [Pleuronectes platessa]